MKFPSRAALFAAMTLMASPAVAQDLTLYSGRGESLVDPLIQAFQQETGIKVNVRYGGTAELAVLLQEEGRASPADLYWAQDAGALGAVADLFVPLPQSTLEKVPAIYRDREGRWIATSGRGRVLAYSTLRVNPDEVPHSILDLTDERYRGRVGWAPGNGSFQAHVTAMRVVLGEEATRAWLADMKANNTKVYRNNTTQVQAIADGEIDFSLPNNYYLLRFLASDPDYPVAQTVFPKEGDIGNLLLVAGMGVTKTSRQSEAAVKFVDFLLSDSSQEYFTNQVYEYPVTDAVPPHPVHGDFERFLKAAPEVDLNDIGDLEGTLSLLRDVGLL